MIVEKVKLIVWDLDDTFWRGTLTEEGIVPIPRNIAMVKELAHRGIVSSICSKNDFERAKAKLVELGIYEYFVFPSISFNPKGPAVAEIVEGAGLRPQNTLFIDDNSLNREEVKFFNPDLIVGDPADLLDGLLDHPHLAGKPDPELTRLKQYQFLQKKFDERKVTTLSNEEFLRASGIRVVIDYDIEKSFDRVVELINRTNQLNYTKKRLNTDDEIAAFRFELKSFGMFAGCVRATDNYGDYGLIGFFLMHHRPPKKKLIHFVFSCRTMSMGIEQYVYELLGKPALTIAGPVSYGIDTHAKIDWINTGGNEGGTSGAVTGSNRVVLLGGCDLLQLASYCSTNRLEFVNKVVDGIKVRYDDPGFVLSDRQAIRSCETTRAVPFWTYEDAVRFDEGVAEADIVLVSLWTAMEGYYFRTKAGVVLRTAVSVRKSLRLRFPGWLESMQALSLDDAKRLALVKASLDMIAARSPDHAKIIILNRPVRTIAAKPARTRARAYNQECARYCRQHVEKFFYIDQDSIVPSDTVVAGAHYSREGYFTLAQKILALVGTAQTPRLSRDAA